MISKLKNTYWYILKYVLIIRQVLFVRPLLCKRPGYKKKYKISICAIFKDEEGFLKEWIEYHNMVGVDHFYLYNNNSSDNYHEVLANYVERGLVTLVDFPYDHAQMKAYKHFYDTYRKETQWVSFLDIDEFFVPIKDNDLGTWIKKFEKYPVVQIYWKMFGTSGQLHHDYSKLVIEQYTSSWDSLYHVGKCFINTDYDIAKYDTTTHHGPIVYKKFLGMNIKVRPVNIFRRSVIGEGFFLNHFIDESKRTIQINHYWSKAWDIYDSKRQKTDVFFEKNPKSDIRYFLRHENENTSCDFTIYKYLMQIKLKLNNIN